MTLGEMIDFLEPHISKTGNVVFDFGSAIPTDIDSWRGVYAELAIGYDLARRSSEVPDMTVKEFYKILTTANNNTYTGWKGGEYYMDRNTEVHVDNPGEWTSTHIESMHCKEWYDCSIQIMIFTNREKS